MLPHDGRRALCCIPEKHSAARSAERIDELALIAAEWSAQVLPLEVKLLEGQNVLAREHMVKLAVCCARCCRVPVPASFMSSSCACSICLKTITDAVVPISGKRRTRATTSAMGVQRV